MVRTRGIALGAFIGSCAIDVAGLQSVGLAVAVIHRRCHCCSIFWRDAPYPARLSSYEYLPFKTINTSQLRSLRARLLTFLEEPFLICI